ncbi:hypothetical protein RJT34_17484 [Clitoria ternatea]|uniref:Uncharacterized protein n=1 Tax=Clitoria ternatea TaxID=43366 RepID=A0AAN9J913_CLITE
MNKATTDPLEVTKTVKFSRFKERLTDDLFLAKVGMECSVDVFTKTVAEYIRRKENFFNELEIVFASMV